MECHNMYPLYYKLVKKTPLQTPGPGPRPGRLPVTLREIFNSLLSLLGGREPGPGSYLRVSEKWILIVLPGREER